MLKIALPMAEEKAASYADCLASLGACPRIVDETAQAEDFDGLLLPGGGDIAPERFGQQMNGSNPPDPALDRLQFLMTDRFVKAGLPVFGICRGHQVINVYFGGDLHQHLVTAADHALLSGDANRHQVFTEKGSFLWDLYGDEMITNTYHHQGVDRPGNGIRICARALDGTVEALCHRTLPVWGVQFHPERMRAGRSEDMSDGEFVLRFFLNACKDHGRN